MANYKLQITKNKHLRTIAIGLLVILIPITYLVLKNPKEAEAAWFNDDWGYRVKTIISNAGSAQTNFQVSITLDTATAITAGKMQSDCDDIRITNEKSVGSASFVSQNEIVN